MENFVRLHTCDNIVIALRQFQIGAVINIDGDEIRLKDVIDFGHKIAVRRIDRHDKVLKYGLSIGSATQNISTGEHVHSHNLKTDYLM